MPVGSVLYVGGLAYEATAQPPDIAMEPNAYIEVSEIFQDGIPESFDQQFKMDGNDGAQTGVYKSWDIYGSNGRDNPVPKDLLPSNVEKDFTIYNNDHVLALEGENAPAYGAQMPGYLMAGLLSDNASTANAVTMQNVLTNYYNSLFGPAANAMEDYSVLFNGTAADPSLSSPPTKVVSFSGVAFINNGGGQSTVTTDGDTLDEAFAYLDAAENTLINANSSGTITSTQFMTDQARVDQIRMYDQFLFYEYKLESDYYSLGIENGNPAINSAHFNTILKDLTNLSSWTDGLLSTNLVNTDNFNTDFQSLTYSDLEYFWANDPNSNGLTTENSGLLAYGTNMKGADFVMPTQTVLNAAWVIDEGILALPPAIPTNLTATDVNSTKIDLSWVDNSDGVTATANDIYQSTNATGSFTQIATTTAKRNRLHQHRFDPWHGVLL